MGKEWCNSMDDFNSQPHKEADLDELGNPVFFAYFNSQPHKEADTNAGV